MKAKGVDRMIIPLFKTRVIIFEESQTVWVEGILCQLQDSNSNTKRS